MLGPLWKLTCRKSAHRCGAKHIPKSKCIKHFSVGLLLEVDLLKKCTPLWREAHFEVKMCKALQCRTPFGSWDVEKALKSARRCGAKHIPKSKCIKHLSAGPLLEVDLLKKCTPLWREAHFEVKMCKAHQCRTTFGSWDVEKALKSARRCGAKHIPKSKRIKHLSVGPLLEVDLLKKCTPLWREAHFEVKMCKALQCRTTFGSWDVEKALKSARRCGAKHIPKSKRIKHLSVGPLLEVDLLKKCTPLWREAHVQVTHAKNWRIRSTFGRSDVVLRGRRKGLCTLSKGRKMWGFCSISKTVAGGNIWRGSAKMFFDGRRSTRDTRVRYVRRSGRWFPERGSILEHRILRFAKMILRDRWSTSYDLASLFVAGAVL